MAKIQAVVSSQRCDQKDFPCVQINQWKANAIPHPQKQPNHSCDASDGKIFTILPAGVNKVKGSLSKYFSGSLREFFGGRLAFLFMAK